MPGQSLTQSSVDALGSTGAVVVIFIGAFLLVTALILKILSLYHEIRRHQGSPRNHSRRLFLVINSVLAITVAISAEIAIAFLVIK